jgi:molybdate transport system substrate-binding protein
VTSRWFRVLAATLLVVGAVACGSSSKPADTSTPLHGELNVFAAASLTSAFTEFGDELEADNEGLTIENTFAGSQLLVTQIEQGAPADVFASADEKNMQKLVDQDLVETPLVFAKNVLQIAVAPGNPMNIQSLADTQKDGVLLVLADEEVPAGKYAREAYEKAGLPAPEPVSNELDVKAVMAKLTTGEADAVVVYVTDVTAAGDKVEGVDIPEEDNVIATYPIAVVKATKNQAAAQAYVAAIVNGDGQVALKEAGFLPPS